MWNVVTALLLTFATPCATEDSTYCVWDDGGSTIVVNLGEHGPGPSADYFVVAVDR